jgi:hypothetical protein
MNYQVLWPDSLNTILARHYVLARLAGFGTPFTQALTRIEARLAADPFADSESRGESLRIMIDAPVTVRYEVDVGHARVTMADIRFARPRQR